MNHSTTEAQTTGIRDWSAKQALLRALYDVGNNKSLVVRIVEGWAATDHEVGDLIDKCYDTFRRWKKSLPTNENSQRFWRDIKTDRKVEVKLTRLWKSSITEFVEFFKDDAEIEQAVADLIVDHRADLDDDTKEQLKSRVQFGSKRSASTNAETLLNEYNLRAHTPMTHEGPQTGIQNGHIQSTMFYNVPESAKAWTALIESKNYRMFLDCLLSLKLLVESDHWKHAVGSGKYNAAVTLGGGGSPEKDWVITKSLVAALKDQGARLQYFINDISPFMFEHSVRFLQRRLKKDQISQRIDIVFDWCDFLKLDVMFRRPECDAVVWALLGGTIGNVSELNFFRSINGRSRAGDLFIVGVDTIASNSLDMFEKRMNTEYRCPELDALLLTPIQGAAAEIGVDSTVVNVSVQAYEDGGTDNYSNVPSSQTAIFSTPSPAEEESTTVLAFSTRYVLEDFLAYACGFGWEHLGTTVAPQNSTFRQLLLRRVQ